MVNYVTIFGMILPFWVFIIALLLILSIIISCIFICKLNSIIKREKNASNLIEGFNLSRETAKLKDSIIIDNSSNNITKVAKENLVKSCNNNTITEKIMVESYKDRTIAKNITVESCADNTVTKKIMIDNFNNVNVEKDMIDSCGNKVNNKKNKFSVITCEYAEKDIDSQSKIKKPMKIKK